MKVKRKSLIIIDENHGGYEGGFCAICRQRGWIDKIKHKKGCPVNSKKIYLEVK